MRGGGRGVSTTMMTKSHHHHYSSPYTTTTTTAATAATDSWAHHRNHQDQDQYMIDGSGGGGGGWGLSWPPRYYTCNFCKREFRSAQALGGHMNVHRRDRARLRVQSPKLLAPISPNYSPNLNLNLIPNPNPNPTAPTLPSPSAPNHDVDHLLPRYRKQVGPAIFDPKKLLVMRRPMSLSGKTSRGRGVVKLGLEIGIFDADDEDDQEEDVEVGVDLELRLGYKH